MKHKALFSSKGKSKNNKSVVCCNFDWCFKMCLRKQCRHSLIKVCSSCHSTIVFQTSLSSGFFSIESQFLKGKICSPGCYFDLSFMSRTQFRRALSSREANRKLLKLFPFVKMAGKHGGILSHLNLSNFF